MPLSRDSIRLRHMLDFSQKAVRFTSGRSRRDLDTDEVLSLAIIHLVEIIGEAAKGVSSEIKVKYPEIPWHLIIGTRDRLIHGYIDINLDIIWTIVFKDLPSLISQLDNVLQLEENTPSK